MKRECFHSFIVCMSYTSTRIVKLRLELRAETIRSVIDILMTVTLRRNASGETKRMLFSSRGYYIARRVASPSILYSLHVVTAHTFSIRISTVVWPCQISIIGCPFRPTGGYDSRNDVVARKSPPTLLSGKIAGQSVYLLDDTVIDISE